MSVDDDLQPGGKTHDTLVSQEMKITTVTMNEAALKDILSFQEAQPLILTPDDLRSVMEEEPVVLRAAIPEPDLKKHRRRRAAAKAAKKSRKKNRGRR